MQGDGFILHRGEKTAYKAKRGQSLFIGDTLITGEGARIQFRLNDKSAIAIADYTKITLTRIFYNAAKNQRSSEVELSFGKGRFRMEKLAEGSKFDIKTPSAIAGIRGSDFALMVYSEPVKTSYKNKFLAWLNPVPDAHAVVPGLATAIVTGELTTVSFAGVVGPAQLVGSFSVSVAAAGAAATTAVTVGAAAATAVLTTIGPGLAIMRMPSHMEK